jgi:hypothetical protein
MKRYLMMTMSPNRGREAKEVRTFSTKCVRRGQASELRAARRSSRQKVGYSQTMTMRKMRMLEKMRKRTMTAVKASM